MQKHNPQARNLVAVELRKMRSIKRNVDRMKLLSESYSPDVLVTTPMGKMSYLQILLIAEVTYDESIKRIAQARRVQFSGIAPPILKRIEAAVAR